jgi:hypothetical protein
MSATRNLQSSALFCLPFISGQPVNVSNGEPAVTAANLTKQTILGAPFKWAWNRAVISFTTEPGTTDYFYDITDYGFAEQAWLTDPNGKVTEIPVRRSLAAESAVQRPQSMAVQLEDADGSITIRLNSIPNVAYQVDIYYQKAPVLMSSLANTWAPIPDHLGYIYDWGFLALVSMLTKDARFPAFAQKFVAHLLGAQDGLTALERNIFLGNWLDVMSAQQRTTANVQQGTQARQGL